MSPVIITISELFESLKHTFKGIDLRVVCFKEDDQFKNALIVLRVEYQDPTSIKRHHKDLFKRFEPIETNNLKVLSESYSINDFPKLARQLYGEKIEIMGRKIFLGRSIQVFNMKGCIQNYVRNLKDMGKYVGSCIEITEGNRSAVFEKEDIKRQVGVYGYRDVYSAVNVLLETNFSSTQGFDFLIYVPIYAKIENVTYKQKTIMVKGHCHQKLGNISLKLFVLKRDPHKDEEIEETVKAKIRFDKALNAFRFWQAVLKPQHISPEHLIDLKLLHPKVGELCGHKGPFREIMEEAERLPLFSILKQFCTEEDIRKGLLEPQKVKKRPDRVFERSISWLLSLLGFSVIWLEEYEKLREPSTKFEYGSIDVLGFHKEKGIFALVNCTIGVPKDNELDRLVEAKRIIEERYGENTKLKIVPIIFSAARQIDHIKQKGLQTGIQVFDGNEIQSIVEAIKSGDGNTFFDSLFSPFFSKLRVH